VNLRVTIRPTLCSENGAALIIILAFVVLLTGLVAAYFLRATTDRQFSSDSFSSVAADILARSALDIVVGDIKQEIVTGASVSSTNIVPQRNVPAAAGIPNLIRVSSASDAGTRASNVNSTTAISSNQRLISRARWNNHYLIPRDPAVASDGDTTPIGTFTSPDWVLMTRSGPVPFASWQASLRDSLITNSNYVIGRYAFAVYDEGGLLDINVAGFPVSGVNAPTVSDIGHKGSAAFANLTALPTTPGNTMTNAAINRFVGFRHYATTQQSNTTSALNFSFSATAITNFVDYYLGSARTGISRSFLTPNSISTGGGAFIRTDQAIVTRQELIALRNAGAAVAHPNSLQYLSTFSRELNRPTWPRLQFPALTFMQRYYLGNLLSIQPNPSDITGPAQVGLTWVAPIFAGSGAAQDLVSHGFWEYRGVSGHCATCGTAKQSAIPSILDGTGKVRTDLDLFQYLNYALFGGTGADGDPAHIAMTLSIGAALIDQYDPNSASYSDTGSLANCPGPACGGSTTTRIDYDGGTIYGMENDINHPDTDPHKPATPPTGLPTDPPSGDAPAPVPLANYYCLNRPFRNVGELGYSWAGAGNAGTLNFKDPPPPTGTNRQSFLLDLFTYNNASTRAGIVSLNSRQPSVLAAVIMSAIATANTSSTVIRGGSTQGATALANDIASLTTVSAALSRADVSRFANPQDRSLYAGDPRDEESKEASVRALAEVTQTRTWGLMIDVIAQSGRYPPNAGSGPNIANPLANFVVEGEKRYWLHIAIDRFTGEVIDQQLEAVYE
jgi:hypothetical protein